VICSECDQAFVPAQRAERPAGDLLGQGPREDQQRSSARCGFARAWVSVSGESEPFGPLEIKAHTPAPRTLQRQASGASLRRSKQDGLASEIEPEPVPNVP